MTQFSKRLLGIYTRLKWKKIHNNTRDLKISLLACPNLFCLDWLSSKIFLGASKLRVNCTNDFRFDNSGGNGVNEYVHQHNCCW